MLLLRSIFRAYTLTWRQMAIFKIGLLALGIAAGVYWHEFFAQYLTALIVVAVLGVLYTIVAVIR